MNKPRKPDTANLYRNEEVNRMERFESMALKVRREMPDLPPRIAGQYAAIRLGDHK